LREQLDDRTMLDLPARMRSLHEEIFGRVPESDLPPVVVTAYSRIMNERRENELEDN
jgi:hypothetical protein